MYTINDVISIEKTYQSRSWDNINNSYKYSDSTYLSFHTNDNKFFTQSDSSSFSYWYSYDNQSSTGFFKLGNNSTDYVFGCESGKQKAIDKLNQLILKYNLN